MSEMCRTVLFCVLLMKLTWHHVDSHLEFRLRRDQDDESAVSEEDNNNSIAGLPTDPEELPEAEPVSPGHTLIQPETGMLMSQSKFPQEDATMLVYGNLENLGITYDKTNHRVLYTGFRRGNIIDTLLQSTDNNYSRYRKPLLIYIRRKPPTFDNVDSEFGTKASEGENNASEVLDDDEFEKANDDFRRHALAYEYKERESSTGSSSESKESSGSMDYERNPGNPYTVFKDKYLQNWMWNHNMDGNHMNINPYGPEFSSMGPSGASLFFNRKWWYFNQDDYRPFD